MRQAWAWRVDRLEVTVTFEDSDYVVYHYGTAVLPRTGRLDYQDGRLCAVTVTGPREDDQTRLLSKLWEGVDEDAPLDIESLPHWLRVAIDDLSRTSEDIRGYLSLSRV